MHFVHLEDFFHPDAGSQVNLLSRLQSVEGHRITVVTAELDNVPPHLTAFFGTDGVEEKDARFERETGVRVVRLPTYAFVSARAVYKPGLVKTVDSLKPDVAFVHGAETLTGMIFILRAARLDYPIVLDSHMLTMASKNRWRGQFQAFYRAFITPRILKNRIPLIRVVDSDYVEENLGIPLSYTDLLSFGTDTMHFAPDPEARRAGRTELGIEPGAFVVLYAGKLDETKGGLFLANAVRDRLVAEPGRPIHFVIIGNSVGRYGEEVERVLEQSANPITRLPTQRYFDLAKFYQLADLAIFPKQCSMSFFEAQACGLPVLFEENETNVQRARSGNAVLFRPEDAEDFRGKLLSLAAMPADEFDRLRERAREHVIQNYDYVPIARRFTQVMERARDTWVASRA